MKIGLISDTHGHLDNKILSFLKNVDEIWHAGDFGNREVIVELKKIKPLRGVYGNIDDKSIQLEFSEDLIFEIDGYKVWMTHIGGYPPKYVPRVRKKIKEISPDLFISGHSHILKIMPDPNFLGLLHINPGAVGHHGFHKVRTMVTFQIHDQKVKDLKVIELGLRGRI